MLNWSGSAVQRAIWADFIVTGGCSGQPGPTDEVPSRRFWPIPPGARFYLNTSQTGRKRTIIGQAGRGEAPDHQKLRIGTAIARFPEKKPTICRTRQKQAPSHRFQ